MADSDCSGCDIGPTCTLPPSMSRVCKEDNTPDRSSMTIKTADWDVYKGPALPSHLTRTQNSEHTSSRRDETSRGHFSNCGLGPSLPPAMGKDEGRRIGGSSGSSIEHEREDSGSSIGPDLPPHFNRGCDSDVRNEDFSQTVSASVQNDQNSENLACDGPTLTPGFAKDSDDDDEEDIYGPALPPGFTSKQDSNEKQADTIGPALPPGCRKIVTEEDSYGDDPGRDEDSEHESSEEEIIGPMPPTERDFCRQQSAAEELDARAAAMKNKLTNKDEDAAPSRDSWMTKLPEFSKNFGMGPRTFRKNARPDEQDRSGWTDTPADRARRHQERMEKTAAEMRSSSSTSKKRTKKEKRDKKLSERDKRLAKDVAKHNQTARPESLMEMHTKTRKRKLEEGGSEEQERRPFDRETDLQVNRFDDARRKQLMKKSAHLDDKFSHSSGKIYL